MKAFLASEPGQYAKKQIACPNRVISWSHTSRFELGLQLARDFAGLRVLDYGCGDGTFLGLLMASDQAPAAAVGCEIKTHLIRDCQNRFGHHSNLSFVMVDELKSREHWQAYDAVVCMEVLEHLVRPELALKMFEGLLVSGGKLLISVPVETGLPLLVKQAVRSIAGWRGVENYPGVCPYTWRELMAGLFAGHYQHIKRPVLVKREGPPFHDHKGFNWLALRNLLATHFDIVQTIGSPLTWLPPPLSSQVWFIAQKR